MKRYFLATMATAFLGFTHSSTASETKLSYFNIPREILAEIIAWAYVNYDDPVEFTRLASVNKECHELIKTPYFAQSCKEKGFVEPAMIFHWLDIFQKKNPNILNEDLNKEDNKKIRFSYGDQKCLAIDNGLFRLSNSEAACLAIWVNPKKTEVYNGNLRKTVQENSKMSLLQYMAQDKKIEEEREKGYRVMKDPITAEPIVYDRNNSFYAYTHADIELPSPIPAKRFVKKWPASYTFKEHVPADINGSFLDIRPMMCMREMEPELISLWRDKWLEKSPN